MIPLHEPKITELDETYVLESLRSGWVSTGGPYITQFENEIAKYTGAKHAVAVANGTVALQLAVEVLKRDQKIEGSFDVLVPTLTFIATGNAVVHAGGRPVFYDTAPQSINSDWNAIERALKENYKFNSATKKWTHIRDGVELLAIMPTHIMGWTGPIEQIVEMASEVNLPVIEDASESLGCRLKSNGKHLGLFGICGALSFNGNKILTTGGGGMIITNDDHFAKRIRHLSTTAKSDGLRYEHDEVGYNFRMVNVLAAMGCSQLKGLDERIARKKSIFERYQTQLAKFPEIRMHQENRNCESNYWLINLEFNSENLREAVMADCIKEGIGVRPLWIPMHKQPAFKHLPQTNVKFENAENAWKKMLSIPSSAHLTDAEVDSIAACISVSFTRHKSR